MVVRSISQWIDKQILSVYYAQDLGWKCGEKYTVPLQSLWLGKDKPLNVFRQMCDMITHFVE